MKKRLGMVIDQERCIGCEACTVACKIENHGIKGWIRVETQNVLRKDTPQGRFPDLRMHFLPQLCNHCENPPCVNACPVEALIKRKDGLVFLKDEKCDGCRICLEICPYDAIIFNQEKEKAEKCNLCAHRIDQGLEPFCVICCEGQAILIGDLNDPANRISQMVSKPETFQRDPETGANPSVYYRPPKEPRGL